VADLQEVNNTLKEQNDLLKGNRAQELENKREQDRKDAEMLKILSNLKPTVEINQSPADSGSLLTDILKGLGLIGAGAAGLAAGLLAGWTKFVTNLITDLGKLLKLDKLKPQWLDDLFKKPKWIDDFKLSKPKWITTLTEKFKMPKWLDDIKFTRPTWVDDLLKKFPKMAWLDELKFTRPTWVDNVIKLFTREGRIGKSIMGIFDGLTVPKIDFSSVIAKSKTLTQIADSFKEITTLLPEGGGMWTRFGEALKGVFRPFTAISEAVSPVFKTIKGIFGAGGTGIIATMDSFLGPMKTVFRSLAKIGSVIAAPLTIIMGLLDAGFETKDAVEKSEGFFASLLNGIIGAIGGFIDGAVFQVVDMLKDGVSWIAEKFGFTGISTFLDSFSVSAIFNDMLDGIYEWVNTLFSDPLAALNQLLTASLGGFLTVGDFILDMIKKPITWILGLFGWDEAKDQVSTFSFSGTVKSVFESAVTWLKSLFTDPVAALTTALASIAGAYLTLGDFVIAPLKSAVAWLLRLFGWDEAADETEKFSFKDTVMGAFDAAVKWVKDLFTWSTEPVKEGDSFIVKTVKTVVQTVEEWFGSMFKFDSTSDIIASLVNVVTWLPNLVAKGVTAVTAWFLELLGFDEKSKAVAEAGKEFSFGGMLMDAIKGIADWFGDLFDVDIGKLAKTILGDTLYSFLFGDKEEQIKELEAEIEEVEKKKLSEGVLGVGEYTEEDRAKELAELTAALKELKEPVPIQGSGQFGNIVDKTGLYMLHGSENKPEFILDNQAAALFMKAATLLSGSQVIAQNGMGSGGTPVIINNTSVDNSSSVNSRQSVTVPQPVRSGESTKAAFDLAYGA